MTNIIQTINEIGVLKTLGALCMIALFVYGTFFFPHNRSKNSSTTATNTTTAPTNTQSGNIK